MNNSLLSQLSEKYQKEGLRFTVDVKNGKKVPELWSRAVSLEKVTTQTLRELWADIYPILSEPLDDFFAAVQSVCLIENAKKEVSLGYIAQYTSGGLAVFEGKMPLFSEEGLDILQEPIARFYKNTHNGFSFNPTFDSLFLPKEKWFTIDKKKYDISDTDEQEMGVKIEQVINFYQINQLLYLGWYPEKSSYVLMDLKYRQAEVGVNPVEEIAPYFFHPLEYKKR